MTRAVLVLGMLAGLMAPVGAEEHDPEEPTFRTERVYFECGDDNKVRLVNGLQGDFDTWTVDEPTESVTDGAGCGTSSTLIPEPEVSGTWEGTFAGNLDTLSVEAHVIDVGISRLPADDYAVVPRLWIDGVELPLWLPDEFYVVAETVRSETELTVRLRFSITGIGLADELGDGTIERSVRLMLAGTEIDSGAFVWGTSEVPSGITFNPEQLESVQVEAD